MQGLYPIIDVDSLRALKLPVLDFARRVLEVRPKLVQLRAKHTTARETLELLRALRELCRARGVELYANDRPDLALLAECDGVHVGQDDLPVSDVRRVAPGLKVGVSTHDARQLEQALGASADYVAFGPVFSTNSKAQPAPLVGLEGLRDAAKTAKAAGVPLVAIGGIDFERAPSIAEVGVGAAVIGALLPSDGDLERVAELARELGAALDGST
jgi:thiamine-phosphate pyrophosphorylase